MTWAEIARGFYLEALLIDGDAVWFTDVVLGGVRRAGSDAVLLPERTMIGGLLQNTGGELLVSGADGIAWVDPASGRSGKLVDGLGGINEMRADGAGGLLFGTIDLAAILAGKRPGPSAIWHLDTNRMLTKLKDGLTFANGLSPSPDRSRLYFNESFAGVRCWALDGTRPLGDPLWAIDKVDCDGMALDSAGNLWITGFASDHLLCLSPEGAELNRLALPGPACTNARFAGAELDDLVVCMVDPAAAQALADGRAIEQQNSAIYRAAAPVWGAPIARTAFVL
jgi:sugar lactone lactonase YvrE